MPSKHPPPPMHERWATWATPSAVWAERWPYFSPTELECRHCHALQMDVDFLDKLQRLRMDHGGPLVVTSGFRCAPHNQAVSTTGASGPHVCGRAVDISAAGFSAPIPDLIAQALRLKINRIGLKLHGPVAGRFIHLEQGVLNLLPAMWTYP